MLFSGLSDGFYVFVMDVTHNYAGFRPISVCCAWFHHNGIGVRYAHCFFLLFFQHPMRMRAYPCLSTPKKQSMEIYFLSARISWLAI